MTDFCPFWFRLCCVESESVCLSLSDECIWFWWSLSLSDDVTEGSPEAFRPTVLHRSTYRYRCPLSMIYGCPLSSLLYQCRCPPPMPSCQCLFRSGIHCESHCLTYSRRSLYRSKFMTRALRAHRVIFMICVLHISNALRPVTARCGNSDLSPSFGYQDR